MALLMSPAIHDCQLDSSRNFCKCLGRIPRYAATSSELITDIVPYIFHSHKVCVKIGKFRVIFAPILSRQA